MLLSECGKTFTALHILHKNVHPLKNVKRIRKTETDTNFGMILRDVRHMVKVRG